MIYYQENLFVAILIMELKVMVNMLKLWTIILEHGDLRLSDLGYYKIDYLKKIDEKKAFFISKLKSTSSVYKKNPLS